MLLQDAPPWYADTLMDRLAHAPVAPVKNSWIQQKNRTKPEDAIESGLVAAVTNMGRFDRIHPMRASPGEVLPEGFSRRCTGFLLCNDVLEDQVNQETVKHDTNFLKLHAIVAYFVGDQQSLTALNN